MATWTCSTGSPPARVGDLEQRRDVLAPALGPVAGGEHRAVGGEDRAAAQVGRHLGQEGQRRLAAARPGAASLVSASGISAKIPTVSLARASWITVVAVCAIAAVLFAISGYTGYTITVVAVGLAAAVNLLPSP